jgi:hypothetical protein
VHDFGAAFEDRTHSPAFAISVKPVNALLRHLGSEPGTSTSLQADATIAEKGRLELSGTAVLQPTTADLQVALRDLPLPAFQGYVDPVAKLRIASGTLGVTGAVQIREGSPAPLVSFKGMIESHGFMTRIGVTMSRSSGGRPFGPPTSITQRRERTLAW